jgi:SAM-dependent methyltransferase
VAKGSTLLDFGCGTGLDAAEYARQGYRVLAYDNSPGMLGQLKKRCHAEIAAGQVIPLEGGYRAFLDRSLGGAAAHAVVADFAVLNSIRELPPLFEMFGRYLSPPGWMVLSVLNPIHWTLLRRPAWWRGAMADGPMAHTAEPYQTYLHFERALLAAASGFRLVGRANAGALVRYDAADGGLQWWGEATPLRRLLWRTPGYRLLGHFVFLVLRRAA